MCGTCSAYWGGDEKLTQNFSEGNEGKRTFGRPRRGWEDDAEMGVNPYHTRLKSTM
jgi:hypothetical protein